MQTAEISHEKEQIQSSVIDFNKQHYLIRGGIVNQGEQQIHIANMPELTGDFMKSLDNPSVTPFLEELLDNDLHLQLSVYNLPYHIAKHIVRSAAEQLPDVWPLILENRIKEDIYRILLKEKEKTNQVIIKYQGQNFEKSQLTKLVDELCKLIEMYRRHDKYGDSVIELISMFYVTRTVELEDYLQQHLAHLLINEPLLTNAHRGTINQASGKIVALLTEAASYLAQTHEIKILRQLENLSKQQKRNLRLLNQLIKNSVGKDKRLFDLTDSKHGHLNWFTLLGAIPFAPACA